MALGLNDLWTASLLFVLIGAVLIIGLRIVSGVGANINQSDATEVSVLASVKGSLKTFADNLGLIATVVVFSLVIAILLRGFGGFGSMGGSGDN